MPNPVGHHWIGGARSAAGCVVLRSLDATTGEPLPGAWIEATAEEVDAAARAALEAFTVYRDVPAARRAAFLDAIAAEIDALDGAFVATVCRETALPAGRIQGERARTSGQLRLFATVLRRGDFHGARIDRAQPERRPLPRPDIRQVRIGIGPVAVFGASNFPLAFSTAGGDTASALAAGCPVVFKAHLGHMATAEAVGEAIVRAANAMGMPAGVFNLLYGDRVGAGLVTHPAIRAVGFTGSLRGGRALCDLAATRPEPIPVFAEMSSVNPVVVLPDALRVRGARIAEETAASVVQGAGQFCTNPGLVLGVRSPAFDAFQDRLAACMADAPPQTMLNAAGAAHYASGLQAMAQRPGVAMLAGGEPVGAPGGQARAHLFKVAAAVLVEGDPVVRAEVFGPSSVVVEAADRDELVRALRALPGQLTATLIGEPDELAAEAPLVAVLQDKVGRLLVNGYPTGVEVCEAMVHGGPYPATSDARGTSVGTLAIDRFLRPVCFQDVPDSLLPDALKNANPLGIARLVDGEATRAALG